MPIEGPLRELGIHDVFQLLDLSRKTGVLRVTSELRHNAGTISFEGGAIIYAEIRSNPHPLGALLLRTGKITEADLERARDMQSRQGDRRRLGKILVDLGALSPRELQRQVRFQIEEVVFEVMSWREGYFSFTEGPITEVPAEAAVRIPTEALLMEGARRIDEWARIEKRVPHLGVVAVFAPADEGAAGDLDLLPPEWEVLATIDGARDLQAIAQALGRSDFDVAKTLFGLESAGLITLVDPGQQPRPRGAAGDAATLVAQAEDALRRRDFERARAAAEQAAAIQPHDAAAHLVLGKIHAGAGRPADAVEELRRAQRLDPLLPAAYRLCGFALIAVGRFAEAIEQWEQWERLAPRANSRRPPRLRARLRRMGHAPAHRARAHRSDEGPRLPLFQGRRSGPGGVAPQSGQEGHAGRFHHRAGAGHGPRRRRAGAARPRRPSARPGRSGSQAARGVPGLRGPRGRRGRPPPPRRGGPGA